MKKGEIWIHKVHGWKTKIKKLKKNHVLFEYNSSTVWATKNAFKEAFSFESKR